LSEAGEVALRPDRRRLGVGRWWLTGSSESDREVWWISSASANWTDLWVVFVVWEGAFDGAGLGTWSELSAKSRAVVVVRLGDGIGVV